MRTDRLAEDVSEDVQVCPEDEPECYDLDKYIEEEYEPECIATSSTTASTATLGGKSVHVTFAMGIFLAFKTVHASS